MKDFKSSILFTLVVVLLAYLLVGPAAALVTLILGIMEVSLSFDNAVVNATVLETMPEVWRKRFVTWGMLIAVGGMRLVFPILIVALLAHLNPMAVVTMALSNPLEYATHLESAHVAISSFGGAFLLMVFMSWAMNPDKDSHWIAPLERMLVQVGKLDTIQVFIALSCLLVTSQIVANPTVLVWGVVGVASFILLEAATSFMGLDNNTAISSGLASFMYLEVLDASFSFDGVIGAFAISREVFVIAMGLGIGAMWVRSLTLSLVKHGTLKQYEYLEHGAHWGIGSLAALMLLSTYMPVPEVVTGLIGVGFILMSLGSSLYKNRQAVIA